MSVIDQLEAELAAPADETGVERAHRNAPEPWKTVAMRAVEAEAKTGRTFEAYTLEVVHGVPEADHSGRWGGIFHAAAERGIIRAVGYQKSLRPTRRGSRCLTWVGNDQPA